MSLQQKSDFQEKCQHCGNITKIVFRKKVLKVRSVDLMTVTTILVLYTFGVLLVLLAYAQLK